MQRVGNKSDSSASKGLKNGSKKYGVITYLLLVIAAVLLVVYLKTHVNIRYGKYQDSEFSGDVVIENWNSKEALTLLNSTKYNEDFFALAHHFQPQQSPFSCGVASLTMVLNALRAPKETIPFDHTSALKVYDVRGKFKKEIGFSYYTQSNVLNSLTDAIKPKYFIAGPDNKVVYTKDQVNGDNEDLSMVNVTVENIGDKYKNRNYVYTNDLGLSLAELGEFASRVYKLKVKLFRPYSSSDNHVDRFREVLKSVLHENEKFIVANFNAKKLGFNTKGGHFAPIVAYNLKADKLLILDPASYRNPWTWVDVTDFYKAMDTKRGYLILSDEQ